MDTLVLSTLTLNTIGIVAIAVAAVVAYCLPRRRRHRGG